MVSINGIPLSEVHPKIIAINAYEVVPEYETEYETAAHMSGGRILFQKRDHLNIVVTFKIRELYDLKERMDIISAVNAWANQNFGILHTLALSTRPGQVLPVRLLKPAAAKNIKDYNEEIELTFTTDTIAYFTDTEMTITEFTGSDIKDTIQVPGNVPGTVDVYIRFTKPARDVNVTVGETKMTFNFEEGEGPADLDIAFNVFTGATEFLAERRQAFGSLSDDSDDVLMSSGPQTPIRFQTDGEAVIQFSSWGWWA